MSDGLLSDSEAQEYHESHTGTHYAHGEIECIDAIRSALGKDGFRAYIRGTLMKYQWRMGAKDDPKVEAAKIAVYAGWLEANEKDEPLRKPR